MGGMFSRFTPSSPVVDSHITTHTASRTADVENQVCNLNQYSKDDHATPEPGFSDFRVSQEDEKGLLESQDVELMKVKAELQKVKEEFRNYKYSYLNSAISKDAANYQDLSDQIRPGKVIHKHKELYETEYLDAMDALQSEDMEAVQRLLAYIVQESHNAVSGRDGHGSLISPFLKTVINDKKVIGAVQEFTITILKKHLKELNVKNIVQAVLQGADIKNFKSTVKEVKEVIEFTESCVRFALSLYLQTPEFRLDSSKQEFDDGRHMLESGCKKTSKPQIDFYIWPTLLCPDAERPVLRRGIVQLKP